MATIYTFKFSDTSKSPDGFTVQPYTTNGILSPSDNTLLPQASAANTTLKLYGKGMNEYGEGIEQNMIYMLENFANSTRPEISIEGQIWYNNVGMGSPILGAELFIRNSDLDDTSGWDAIILATGTSAMVAELTLSGDPLSPLSAIPKQYADAHFVDPIPHLIPAQNTYLNNLDIYGSPPALKSDDTNQLIGITDNVQVLIDARLALAGGTMDVNASIDFSAGGSIDMAGGSIDMAGGVISGVPLIPLVPDEVASKQYVDNNVASGGADGVLTGGIFTTSPNTLTLNVDKGGSLLHTVDVLGIAAEVHGHQASEVFYDATTTPSYPGTVQLVIEYIEDNKADLLDPIFPNDITVTANITANVIAASTNIFANGGIFTGTVQSGEPSAPNDLTTKNYVDSLAQGGTSNISIVRTFDALSADLIGTPYKVQSHNSGDNLLTITVNGMKQYNGFGALQDITYTTPQSDLSFTGLDPTVIYEFNITLDTILYTVIISSGSPITSFFETQEQLIGVINNEFLANNIPVSFSLLGEQTTTARFLSVTTGSGSSVVISDPGSTNTYLFDESAPQSIVTAAFVSDIPSTGSPAATPDTITVSGDQTSFFPVGKTFSIRDSDDATYGSYDGAYSVHINGATFDLTNTIIPIADITDPALNIPLLPSYSPSTGSPITPLPNPIPYGDIYLTPLANFKSVSAPIAGIDGDYIETDSSGAEIFDNQPTGFVVFNVTIPLGSQIETLLLV